MGGIASEPCKCAMNSEGKNLTTYETSSKRRSSKEKKNQDWTIVDDDVR